MSRAVCLFVLTVALSTTRAGASDFNALGFYLGAAVGLGSSTVESIDGSTYWQADSAVGFKAMAGLRPLSFLGAEADYIYYGSSCTCVDSSGIKLHTRTDAAALYAVGYLPIPLPFLDIFAKAGWARIHATGDERENDPTGSYVVNVDHTDSNLAYGAGIQWKSQSLAFRVEYERTSWESTPVPLDTSKGHPTFWSFGITWTF